MFEVIISMVRSGKVERKSFGTREEAENYVTYREQRYLYNPKVKHWNRRSLRDLRTEINFRAEQAPRTLTMPALAAAA